MIVERVHIGETMGKPSLTRTKFASFTSSEPTLGLGLMVQYISNTFPQTHDAV